jgi:hypothetical protein
MRTPFRFGGRRVDDIWIGTVAHARGVLLRDAMFPMRAASHLGRIVVSAPALEKIVVPR